MSRVTKSITPEEYDAVLEMAAQAIEGASFTDFAGISAPRKHDREIARARADASREERKQNAETIRRLKGRRSSDAIEMLRKLSTLDERQHVMHLIDAWPLAWKGWLTIEAMLVCNRNQIPPECSYRIRLTDTGRQVLATPAPSPEHPDAD